MKTIRQLSYRVLALFFLLSCQTEPSASLKLMLFQADWCPPCKSLEKELAVANIQTDWRVDDEGCIYHVLVERIDYSDFEKNKKAPHRNFKKTDSMPEQALFLDEKLIANDNYSDKASLESFIRSSIKPFKDGNPRAICEPKPGFIAQVKRFFRITPF